MDRKKREELKQLVKDLIAAGCSDSDIVIQLVLRAPLNFSHAGATKFIHWVKNNA